MLNQKSVTVTITRTQLCDLLIACTTCDHLTGPDTKKWAALHDLLRQQLEDFDADQNI